MSAVPGGWRDILASTLAVLLSLPWHLTCEVVRPMVLDLAWEAGCVRAGGPQSPPFIISCVFLEHLLCTWHFAGCFSCCSASYAVYGFIYSIAHLQENPFHFTLHFVGESSVMGGEEAGLSHCSGAGPLLPARFGVGSWWRGCTHEW